MTTYIYETIPANPDETPEVFEWKQRMTDPALTCHPRTGQPVRRVISGGLGYFQKGKAQAPAQASCGSGCGCHA